MPFVTMTIKLITPAGDNKPGSIVGMDGSRLGAWPETICLFEVGKTYEVEFTEAVKNNRTYRNVKGAKLATPAPAREPFVSGAYRSNEATSVPPAGHRLPSSDDERIFVVALLKSMIESGQIKNDKRALWEATQMLRGLYRFTFGAEGIEPRPFMEAAE